MVEDDIYRKTEKGRAEITTRVNELGLRERTMLIMVDDKTTRSDLLAKNTHPTSGGILDALLAQGFIEVDSGARAASASAGPAAASPAAVEISLISASRFACRALVAVLGPGADDLTALIEKCKSIEELTARLEKSREVIQGMAGKKMADEFWAGVSARLPQR